MRKKKNRTGSISVPILGKRNGKLHFIQTVGHATDEACLQALKIRGHHQIIRLKATQSLDFLYPQKAVRLGALGRGDSSVKNVVSIRLLEQLFVCIGFDALKDDLFRHLVVMRLLCPVSKPKTIEYLYHHYQISYDIDQYPTILHNW